LSYIHGNLQTAVLFMASDIGIQNGDPDILDGKHFWRYDDFIATPGGDLAMVILPLMEAVPVCQRWHLFD